MNLKFWKKEKENIFDKCTQCNKDIDNFDLLSLQKIDGEDEDGDPIVSDEKLFCSEKCLEEYLKTNESKDYQLMKLSRCSCYYDCKKIDNLRRMCEKEESVQKNTNPLFPDLTHLIHKPFCDPANAGIIKASLKLKEQAEKASRISNIQFTLNIIFTVIIIFLTIGNFLLVSNDSSNELIKESNEKLNTINSNQEKMVDSFNEIIEQNNKLIQLQEENNNLTKNNTNS